MAVIESFDTTDQGKVFSNNATKVAVAPRPVVGSYRIQQSSGLIGAALAANSSVYAHRLGPTSNRILVVKRIVLKINNTAAFTAQPNSFGIVRITGANASGGTAIPDIHKDDTNHPDSDCLPGGPTGGDIRIATTGALTVAGITFNAGEMPGLNFGILPANSFAEREHGWATAYANPFTIRAGQGFVVRNPLIMGAGGTYHLTVMVEFEERLATDTL